MIGCNILTLRFIDRSKKRMNVATLSPKFQIVIPTAVREHLTLQRGMKFQVIPYGQRIELIPLEPMKKARGMFKGIDTTIVREPDREL